MLQGYIDWKFVVQTPDHCRLCERGMIKKYSVAKIPVYNSPDYADICKVHSRYRLSYFLVPLRRRDKYKQQLFYQDNGRVLRAIVVQNEVRVEEFSYIHLQKRQFSFNPNVINGSFYIAQNKLIQKEEGVPSPEIIAELNPYKGVFYELLESIGYELRTHNVAIRLLTEAKGRLYHG